ncbi:hypothetical protein V2J09_012313 [Rumex salicifolius]
MGRAPCCDKNKVKRGPWSLQEDTLLKNFVHLHGTGGNWITLPPKAGLNRCGKSCRLRWLNYLRPNIKHGGFTNEEDHIICALYSTIGSRNSLYHRWSVIASNLSERTDNDVKNYWNTKLKKKILAGKVTGFDDKLFFGPNRNDSDSTRFTELMEPKPERTEKDNCNPQAIVGQTSQWDPPGMSFFISEEQVSLRKGIESMKKVKSKNIPHSTDVDDDEIAIDEGDIVRSGVIAEAKDDAKMDRDELDKSCNRNGQSQMESWRERKVHLRASCGRHRSLSEKA